MPSYLFIDNAANWLDLRLFLFFVIAPYIVVLESQTPFRHHEIFFKFIFHPFFFALFSVFFGRSSIGSVNILPKNCLLRNIPKLCLFYKWISKKRISNELENKEEIWYNLFKENKMEYEENLYNRGEEK